MAALHKLTNLKLKNAPPGKYNDGGGLWFHRRADGGGQWFLRITIHGRRREMGLGAESDVSLKQARDFAQKWRSVAKSGKDPIFVRENEAREAARNDKTLAVITAEAFEAHKSQLKDDGNAGRWLSPLTLHVLPKIGAVPIDQIDQRTLVGVLRPIWNTKADTARKITNRLNIVFKHAAALDLNVDLQAVAKAKHLLGRSTHKPKSIAALHWKDVPKFYEDLKDNTPTELALKLLVLTAARSAPIRFAQLDHFDGDVWTIPAERMKARKGQEAPFRIPLSDEAKKVLELAKAHERDGFLFPNVRKGVISDATMAAYMTRLGMKERPHGFRTSFRTWCAEVTDTPKEIAETALAHVSGSSVELAYRRTDYLEKRAVLMQRWGDFVAGNEAKVVKLLPLKKSPN